MVYSALDVDGDELTSMRVYPARNPLTSQSFIKGVLRYCEGKNEFIVDNAPRLKDALITLGLAYHHQTRGLRSLIESTSPSFKQRAKNILQQNNNQPKTQPTPKMEKSCGTLEPILQNIHILL